MFAFILIGILVLINAVFQSSFLPFIEISGAVPDTLIVLIVIFANLAGPYASPIIGFAGGFILDALFGYRLGLLTFQYVIIGLAIAFLSGKLSLNYLLFSAIGIVASYVIKATFLISEMLLNNMEFSISTLLLSRLLSEMIYTLALTPIFAYVCKKIFELKSERKDTIPKRKIKL